MVTLCPLINSGRIKQCTFLLLRVDYQEKIKQQCIKVVLQILNTTTWLTGTWRIDQIGNWEKIN